MREHALPSNDFAMTEEEIVLAGTSWANFNGFTGEQCYHKRRRFKSGVCDMKVNMPAGGPGWHCPACGHYNFMMWNNSNRPFVRPDYGPSGAVIVRAIKRLHDLRDQGKVPSYGRRSVGASVPMGRAKPVDAVRAPA